MSLWTSASGGNYHLLASSLGTLDKYVTDVGMDLYLQTTLYPTSVQALTRFQHESKQESLGAADTWQLEHFLWNSLPFAQIFPWCLITIQPMYAGWVAL